MKAEEVKPYDDSAPKEGQVEKMFDSIAPRYDFMNTAMTMGLHRRWLRKALAALPSDLSFMKDMAVADLATGTGHVALRLADTYPYADIVGIDLSEGMLAVARKKAEALTVKDGAERRSVKFEAGNCLALDYPDNHFSLLTIAYGVRNLSSLMDGFREFHRVLKQGGVCMILELSVPEGKNVKRAYNFYTRRIIPGLGRLVSRDPRAYTYLPESIAAMPKPSRVAEMLREAGFGEVQVKPLTFGVVTYYIARK